MDNPRRQQVQEDNIESLMRDAVGAIAHKIVNTFAGLQGYLQLMKMTRQPAPGATAISIAEMQEILDQGVSAIRQLQTLGRVSFDDDRPIQLIGTVDDAVLLLRVVLPPGVSVATHPERKDAIVQIDPARLQQILTFTALGLCGPSPGFQGRIIIDSYQEAVEAAPMPSKMYENSVATITMTFQGNVVGGSSIPSIPQDAAYSLRDAMGVARISRNENGDVKALLSFPAMVIPKPELSDDCDNLKPEALEATGSRVLFVDDETTLTQLASITLERLGHVATVSNSGFGALELIQADPGGYDIVITDHTMPDILGNELGRRVRALRSDLPIVVVTGNAEAYSRSDADLDGFHFLQKPYTLKQLRGLLRQILNPDL